MSHHVLKFGGSVLCDAENIYAAAAVTAEIKRQHAVTVVVSATKGSTDALLACSELARVQLSAALQRLHELHDHHVDTATSLLSGDDLTKTLKALDMLHSDNQQRLYALNAKADDSVLAALLASGEKLSATIFRAALQAQDVNAEITFAEQLIATSGPALSAQVDFPATQQRFRSFGDEHFKNTVIVVPGFSGANADGETTILGRNASDYSAALVARYVADELVIFGDTDGVYTTDPNRFVFAQPLEQLNITDAEWLARSGAPVVHPRTFEPLQDRPVAVRLRALHSRHGGTLFRADAARHAVLVTVQNLSKRGKQLDKAALTLPTEAQAFIARFPQHAHAHLVSVLLPNDASTQLPAGIARQDILASEFIASRRVYLLLVADTSLARVVRALHEQTSQLLHRVAVAVVGASGRIGKQLVQLLLQQRRLIEKQFAISLDIVAACNSKQAIVSTDGFGDDNIVALIDKAPLSENAADDVVQFLLRHPSPHRILVDATASADIAAFYTKVLAHGIGIVTPNKIANASSTEQYNTLQTLSLSTHTPYGYETTVGAALPVLKTIAELIRAGDKVEAITAALSGTIGYVLTRVQQGEKFSVAVQEAVNKGYAEPNPLIDLSGEDVARKLLVLLRTAGYTIERDQINVQSLANLANSSATELNAQDDYWATLVHQTQQQGKKLVYVANFDNGVAEVGLRTIGSDSPFYQLNAVENCLLIRSQLYQQIPLCVRGPGAGIEVTAAGVLNDVIEAARTLVARSVTLSQAA